MSSLPPIVAPTVPAGTGLVNARALDAVFTEIVAKVNALIAAVGQMREPTQNWLGDRVVRWRMLREDTRELIARIASISAANEAISPFTYIDPRGSSPLVNPGIYEPVGIPRTVLETTVFGFVATPAPFDAPVGLYEVTLRFRGQIEGVCVEQFANVPFTLPTDIPYNPLPSWAHADGRTFMTDEASPSQFIQGRALHDFASIRVFDVNAVVKAIYILNGVFSPYGAAEAQLRGAQQGYSQDAIITLKMQAGDYIEFAYNNTDALSIMTTATNTPPDDDPRFPYAVRYRDGAGMQLDLMRVRFLPVNFTPIVITTETGAWLEFDGPGGFIYTEAA